MKANLGHPAGPALLGTHLGLLYWPLPIWNCITHLELHYWNPSVLGTHLDLHYWPPPRHQMNTHMQYTYTLAYKDISTTDQNHANGIRHPPQF